MGFFSSDHQDMTSAVQKAKNLSALAILLTGLFIGSLFVDFVQLATGRGFSGSAVRTHNLLEAAGKTWVAYGDPKVSVEVVTDKSCAGCDPSEALIWLRRAIPTLEATEVSADSDHGKALIAGFDIVTLPALVFSKSVTQTDFYTQASSLFRGESGSYFFDMSAIGLPIGKYLVLPEVRAGSIAIGPKDAKVKVIEYSDFQCPYCKAFHADLMKAIGAYKDQVLFVYKQLPLSIHKQSENAANAALCANEQGKFPAYAEYLFQKQDEWGVRTDTQRFKDYAWYLRLDGRSFAKCLDSKKYQAEVDADAEEAARFSVSGTPGTFVNGTFFGGAVSADDLQAAIKEELAR